MKRICTLIGLILLLCDSSFSQEFGGFPPSTKWKQINSDTVRVIFTQGAEWQAQRIATLIHKTASDTSLALGNRLRKINVLLQSKTTLANGYVALAPFRSEFFLVPGTNAFDFGNLPWYEALAIHEYRHVHQYNNFRNGISKVMSLIFGEQGQALANALTIPDWFFEGDAVHAETALTSQGRGRLPYFLSGYNSLWLEGKNYNWQKLRNGSLKDYVPHHYQLGYLMNNYGYLKYGNDFWSNVTKDASAFKGLFYPFQKAVKKYSGVNYKTFRKEAIDYYSSNLKNEKQQPQSNPKTVTSYYYPQYISADSLLYLKSAYNKIPAFYLRDSNGEEKISLQNISSEDWFSYRNGKIAYTAYSTNPRWGLVDYSDIVILDIKTKSQKRITSKQRYYNPDFSPSGNKIVAVKITDSVLSELHVINNESGDVKKFTNGYNYYINPRFADERRVIVSIRTPDSKVSLQILDTESGIYETLIPESYNTISTPFIAGNRVYFTSNASGNDEVYELHLQQKKIYRLTNGFTGNYFASAMGDTIVWSHYTTAGLELRKQAISTLTKTEITSSDLIKKIYQYPVANENNILSTRTERSGTKRYEKSTGFFNFHSWAPDYTDPEFTFSLYGNNILNTVSNELFYRYNINETSHGIGWNTSYGGWYPKINAGVEYTYNRSVQTTSAIVDLDQFEARIGYDIPLNFTKGKLFKYLDFGTNYVFNRSAATGFYKDSFAAQQFSYMHHFISWSHFLPKARQHIYPKFGYSLTPAYRNRFGETGHQFVTDAHLFLPSIANHSFIISGSFQDTDTSNRIFSNRFANSRGYDEYYFSRMWKLGGDYHFPIIYPDLGFANIIYFQRVRGNVFYDHTMVYSNDKLDTRQLRSTGFEIFFDTRWWNQLPISFGFRMSHLLDNGFNNRDTKGSNYFEFILPLDLIPD